MLGANMFVEFPELGKLVCCKILLLISIIPNLNVVVLGVPVKAYIIEK